MLSETPGSPSNFEVVYNDTTSPALVDAVSSDPEDMTWFYARSQCNELSDSSGEAECVAALDISDVPDESHDSDDDAD